MEGTLCGCGDKGQIDVRAGHAGQLDLCLLGSVAQSLQNHLVAAKIYAILCLELLCHPIDDALVEVIAAQLGITVGCQNLEDTIGDLEQRYVEGTAAKVEDHDLLILFLIHTVSKRCRGRLVDNSLNLKTGNLTCILGSLTLCVGEVCGNGDNSLGDGCTQEGLCVTLQLLQNHSGNLLRGILLIANVRLEISTHVALDGNDGSVGVGDGLTLCDLTYHTLAGLREADDRGSGSRAFRIRNNAGLAALKYGDARVGCTQINTNDFSHDCFLQNISQIFSQS